MQTFTLWKQNTKRKTQVGHVAGYWFAIKRAKELSLLKKSKIVVYSKKKTLIAEGGSIVNGQS